MEISGGLRSLHDVFASAYHVLRLYKNLLRTSIGHEYQRSPCQTTVTTSLPTPAVNAIASAPQNTTRSVGLITGAPPARADIAPSAVRTTSEVPATTGTTDDAGDISAASNGMAAPAENVSADVNAACTGLALVSS